MSQQLLKSFIVEIVQQQLNEITARKGPRTGGFEFDKETIQEFMKKIKAVYPVLANDPDRLTKKFKDKVAVRSPITNKVYKIPVVFYWDPSDRTFALAQPYLGGGKGLMSVNLSIKGDESWLRSTIVHELTHLFDPKVKKDESHITYYEQSREQKAFLGTLIQGMMDDAEKIKQELQSTDTNEKKSAQRTLKKIIARPWELYELQKQDTNFKNVLNYYEKNPGSPFMRKLNTSAFDIVQAYLKPLIK